MFRSGRRAVPLLKLAGRQMLDWPFIVVSGAPGSGKTAVGVAPAAALDLLLLDKDDILEALFDAFGDADVGARQRLS
jgi:hypothetical protein